MTETTETQAEPDCFIINALAECFRQTTVDGKCENEHVVAGHVNIMDMAREALKPADLKLWSKRYRRHGKNTPILQSLNAHVDRYIKLHFYKDAYENLTREEFDFYCRVTRAQRVNTSRFRIWGQLPVSGKPVIRLITEFCWWVDDTAQWDLLRAKAAEIGYEEFELHTGPYLDQSYNTNELDAAMATGLSEDEARQKVMRCGEHNGRMERQVELWRNVYGWKLKDIRAEIERVSLATQELWEKCGVGVC